MADRADRLFTDRATERLRSPDDLDNYLRVTNPSLWVVLAACICLVAGLVAWGLFGTVTTSIATHGARLGGETVVFLTTDEVEKIHVGDAVSAGDTDLKVAEISDVPISRDEAREVVGSDYLLKTLVADDWVYVVRLTGEGADALLSGKPLAMRIECERTAPLSVIFGQRTGE